jgi:hypothetical protein
MREADVEDMALASAIEGAGWSAEVADWVRDSPKAVVDDIREGLIRLVVPEELRDPDGIVTVGDDGHLVARWSFEEETPPRTPEDCA